MYSGVTIKRWCHQSENMQCPSLLIPQIVDIIIRVFTNFVTRSTAKS